MKRFLTVTAIMAAMAAAPSTAWGHMREGGLEVGAYLTHANFDHESNIENDEGFGGRLGILFSREHELEFTLDRIPTQDNFGQGLNVDLTTFKAGYIYNFSPHTMVSPLFTAGGGFQNLQVSQETSFGTQDLVDETDPLAYAGFGLRFFVGEMFNIRVEGQAVAVFPDGDPDNTLVDGVVSAGVGWVIGGH